MRSLRYKLLTGSLLTIGLPLVAFAVVGATLLWRFYLRELEVDLDARARVIGDALAPSLAEGFPAPGGGPDAAPSDLLGQVMRWAQHARSRVTVADARGIVRASSTADGIGRPIDETRRPGLGAAVRGRPSRTVWKSPNFAYEDTMYVNVPVRFEGRLVGAVRVAHNLQEIQQRVTRVRAALLTAVLVYAALLSVLAWALAHDIVRPIEALRRDALKIAAGDLSQRVAVQGEDEIAQLAATLNQMTARLEVLEGLRRRYVSDVSHEFRTPLTAIRSMAETIIRYGDSDPAMRGRYLPRIVGQIERLARMATQLLELAQLEGGVFVDGRDPTSLADVIDEVAHSYAPRAAELGLAFTWSAPPSLPRVLADRDRLVQVFVNLLDNAFRYTPAGGAVALAACAGGGEAEVTVEDSGRGIPAEHLPHLFERFYRVEAARSPGSGGAGLGLAIVREIVEAHGGRIAVASAAGRGTTVTVTLPTLDTTGRSSHAPTPSREAHA